MLSDPLATGGLFSTHWTVVLIVGLLFFSLQVALTLRVSLSLRRQERMLLRLCRDLDQGGDGRHAVDTLPESFAWLKWVIAIFPAGTATPPGNYTRDSVLQELDTRLASNSSYLLLQRMGVMAPLLGVILTVAGFWYLRVEESGEMQLQDILFAVTPLVSGVGAGAVLALINQGLLHWSSQRIESLRMIARTWFDIAIWNSVGLDSQAATVNGIAAVERMAVAVSDAADQHADCANRLTASSSAINDSAREFRGAVQAFGGQIQGVPQTLGDLTKAIQTSSAALESLIHVGSRAVANLDVSVAAFRTTVDNDFANVARQQQISMQGLADAVRHVGTTTESLKLSSQDLKETIDSSKASCSSLNEALEHQLLPGQQQFQTLVGHLSARLEALTGHLESLAGQVSATASEFHTAFGRFPPAVSVFRSAVEHQFAPAAARHHQQVAAVSETVEKLKESASNLSHSTAAVQSVSRRQGEFADTAGRTQHVLVGAVESLATVASQLQTTVDSHIGPSNRILHGAATSFAKSVMQLSSVTNGELGQLTSRLTELNDTLSRLEETFASLQRFSRVSDDIDRLTESLSRVADVTDAIANLPEGVRRTLDATVAETPHHTTARDRIMNWFSRSPR